MRPREWFAPAPPFPAVRRCGPRQQERQHRNGKHYVGRLDIRTHEPRAQITGQQDLDDAGDAGGRDARARASSVSEEIMSIRAVDVMAWSDTRSKRVASVASGSSTNPSRSGATLSSKTATASEIRPEATVQAALTHPGQLGHGTRGAMKPPSAKTCRAAAIRAARLAGPALGPNIAFGFVDTGVAYYRTQLSGSGWPEGAGVMTAAGVRGTIPSSEAEN